jgi:hypothetical protein
VSMREVSDKLAVDVLEYPLDTELWSPDQRDRAFNLFKLVTESHMQLDDSVPCIVSSIGYSIKHSINNHPICHDLKKLLKHIALDYLLRCVEPACQTALRCRIVKSGKPNATEDACRNKYLDLLNNYWYSYNSVGIFLTDLAKWHTLPKPAKNVVYFMQLLAQQFITRDVSPFCVATFAVAIFLYLPAISTLKLLNANDSKLLDTSAEHNLIEKKSLYTHTLAHGLQQLQMERPIPFMIGCEGTVDFILGQLKHALGKSVSGRESDLENMVRLYLLDREAKAAIGLISEQGTLRYELGGDKDNRLKMLLAPCFVTDPLIAQHVQAFVKDCDGKAYRPLVLQFNNFVIIGITQTEFLTLGNRPISLIVPDVEWIVISLCEFGTCPTCLSMN